MSVKWTPLCVSKSATTQLEAMSANVKMGTSLWQELTSVQVICHLLLLLHQYNISKRYA